jgi:hypothetical protein
LKTPQLEKARVRSGHRHDAISRHPKPETDAVIRKILSDQTHPQFPVFRSGLGEDNGITVVVGMNWTCKFYWHICKKLIRLLYIGIFDITNKLWRIYSQTPSNSDPIAVLPMTF